MPLPLSSVRVREVTIDDAPVIARHRAEMFRAMGQLEPATYPKLLAEAEGYFATAIPAGEYQG